MALIANLQFGDNDSGLYSNTYTLCDVKCHIGRQRNRYRPDSRALCEGMEVTVVAPGKNDLTLLEWYINRSPMSGRIVIAMSNEAKMDASSEKVILFENAVCFKLTEDYHIDNNRRRLLTLSFEAEQLTLDNQTFSQSENPNI